MENTRYCNTESEREETIALADIYDKYGSQLLEGNVRSFLSTKVAVNKKIRETILKCPSMFFAYNNGVSATAMDVQLERTVGGTHIVGARDFQIINGGQTTASLSNTRHKDKADLEGIYVQMKLTEIDESDTDRSTELVRNISRSSNSQNKVTDAKSLTKCRVDTRVNDSLRSLIEHYPRVSTFNKRKRNVLCTKLWTCLQEQEA